MFVHGLLQISLAKNLFGPVPHSLQVIQVALTRTDAESELLASPDVPVESVRKPQPANMPNTPQPLHDHLQYWKRYYLTNAIVDALPRERNTIGACQILSPEALLQGRWQFL